MPISSDNFGVIPVNYITTVIQLPNGLITNQIQIAVRKCKIGSKKGK